MTPEQAKWWKFNGKLTDACEVKCSHCGEFSPLTEWDEVRIECETCGEHEAMECPKCLDETAYVGNRHIFDIREPI